ncbi:MAG: anthrone oxygenase family protein [Pseudomonadota bacterium]
MSTLMFLFFQLCVLSYALLGGVFLAFSDFIMRALGKTGGVAGAETMQLINREVFRWVFMSLFLGMAAASAIVALYGAFNLDSPVGTTALLAGLIYLVGCFAVTVFFNVPMNEALAEMDTSSEQTLVYWTDVYLPRWTRWNTVRACACAVSSVLLLMALLAMANAGIP